MGNEKSVVYETENGSLYFISYNKLHLKNGEKIALNHSGYIPPDKYTAFKERLEKGDFEKLESLIDEFNDPNSYELNGKIVSIYEQDGKTNIRISGLITNIKTSNKLNVDSDTKLGSKLLF